MGTPSGVKVAAILALTVVVGVLCFSVFHGKTRDRAAQDLRTATTASIDDDHGADNDGSRPNWNNASGAKFATTQSRSTETLEGAAADYAQGEGSAREKVRFADLPIDVKESFYAEKRKKGSFSPDDIKRYGYDQYDKPTMISLARNGDPLAEFVVIAYGFEYPEEVRREVAISSAKLGRTFGLTSLGSAAFDYLDSDAPLPVNYTPPTKEQMVKAFGMLLAAETMDPSVSESLNYSKDIALKYMSVQDVAAARTFANDLTMNVGR